MRPVHLLASALLASIAASAMAAEGVSLRWGNCYSDGGVPNRNFACNSNAGAHALVGSFELGSPLAQVSGQEFIVDVQTATASLPAWWQFKNPFTCRQTSLSVNFVLPASAVNCLDWADGQAVGGLGAYDIGYLFPNRARILGVSAVPQSALAALDAGNEYFSFTLVINNLKTVGTGACPGCLAPANLSLVQVRVTTPAGANDRTLGSPLNGGDSSSSAWQGGFPTATRQETWGAVKALYR